MPGLPMAYDHKAIEARWQKFWLENKTFLAERHEGRPKYYVLDMFPYPSGSGLHVGHPEGYTATDILARYKRMRGFDVLHPMGWDAFGLPAEQYAIQTGTHPRETTKKNIDRFRAQLSSLGFAYDWDREVNTTSLDYVRWTQWIFLQLFHRGLAFQSEIPVNWCEALGTVLANEEVIDGRSERGSHPVERRPLRQWQLRITAYADRLADDLEGLDWPETKQKQRDWIGRSEGARVRFAVAERTDLSLEVFTTRPDTLFGATYLVVAPDHSHIDALITPEQAETARIYVERARKKSDLERTSSKEKTGVFTGSHALHPLTGDPLPIYVGDYVLGAYGTGAIMAVPAHDARDFEFARAFNLPVVEVVSPDGALHEGLTEAFTEPGVAVRSPGLDGLSTAQAQKKMIELLEAQSLGQRQVNYKLRDWVFSRQRYWGEPIPIYFPVKTAGDPRKGAPHEIDYSRPIPLEESELPLELPELEDYRPGDPAGALVKALEWRFFQKDGQWFARETNTMPQWAGSCWYYLRYLDPRNEQAPFSQKAYDDWMPVDLYMGGSEHAVLHLLYARFWHKVLFDIGVVQHPEPFQRLVHQGMILGMVYRYFVRVGEGNAILEAFGGAEPRIVADKEAGGFRDAEGRVVEARFLVEPEIAYSEGKPIHPELKVELLPIAEKMSKARGNVVNPDDVVREFGADSLRLYEMFMGPLEHVKPWQTSGLLGVRRFLDKVEALSSKLDDMPPKEETQKLLHRTIKKVTEDLEGLRFNTCISTMMIFANHLAGEARVPRSTYQALLTCLCPFAPHLAEDLALRSDFAPLGPFGEKANCLSTAAWPSWDEAFCVDDVLVVPVQVNGKVRGRITIARDADPATVESLALGDPGVQQALGGKPVQKVVYVPGRILNLIAP